MEIRNKVAVVTGAASGIGRAVAMRFAQDGARGVVVADLDLAGAQAVAGEIGEVGARALAVRCDVSVEADIQALVAAAREQFGQVDIYISNAGILGRPGGFELDDALWDKMWQVHGMAHVWAARAVVPDMVARGEGYFLSTASAAGLLTQIGSAQYSVSKHAAVAFSEWLSVTYGDRGVRVSCLCPMGVNTPLLTGAAPDVDPEAGRQATSAVKAAGAVLEPEEVADVVVDALGEERFLVLPHPEVLEFWRRKSADPDRWLAGMRRLQAAIGGAGI